MARKKEKDHGFDDGSFVVKKNRKFDIFAFIVCLLVAFVIWAYAEGRANDALADASGENGTVTVTETETQES